jgi:hypothetical protein
VYETPISSFGRKKSRNKKKMSSAFATVPHHFNKAPFIMAVPVFLSQLVLWPLSTLQLLRAYAWLSGMNPLQWVILTSIYAGVTACAALVNIMVISKKKHSHVPKERLEVHVHPALACMIYCILSLLHSAPGVMTLVYYYAHFGGEPPLAVHTGDVPASHERRSIWLAGHVIFSVSCMLGIFQFLTQIIVPSITYLRLSVEQRVTPAAPPPSAANGTAKLRKPQPQA